MKERRPSMCNALSQRPEVTDQPNKWFFVFIFAIAQVICAASDD